MAVNPNELISTTKIAYKAGDVATLRVTIPQTIAFIEEAIAHLPSKTKLYANGGLRPLRLIAKNVGDGKIGIHDEECFCESVKFLTLNILLPDLKNTNPQAVKDSGLWDKCE